MNRQSKRRQRKQESPSPEEIKPLLQQIQAVRKRATSEKLPAESNRQPSIFVDEVEATAHFYARQISHLQADNSELSKLLYQAGKGSK